MHSKETPQIALHVSTKHPYKTNLSEFRAVYRKEIVRLIGHELIKLGLPKTGAELQRELDFQLFSPSMCVIQQCIKDEAYTKLLAELDASDLIDPKRLTKAKHLVHAQIVLRLIADNKPIEALKHIRQQLSPLALGVQEVKTLTMRAVQGDPAALKTMLEPNPPLYEQLQTCFMQAHQGPEEQLSLILLRHLKAVEDACYFHNPPRTNRSLAPSTLSLLKDHSCAKETSMPIFHSKTFNVHTDEVWFLLFSPNHERLISISKDPCMIVWDFNSKKPVHSLHHEIGEHYIHCAAWRSDNKYVLLGTTGSQIKIVDADHGKIAHSAQAGKDPVLSVCWHPSGSKFFTLGNKSCLDLWDFQLNSHQNPSAGQLVSATVLHSWAPEHYLDMAITPDGKHIYVAIQYIGIKQIDLETYQSEYFQIDGQVMSLCMHTSGKYLLIFIREKGLHLYNIKKKKFTQKYFGFAQVDCSVDPQFGGAYDQFVVSGSENGRVMIWHTQTGKLLDIIQAHTKTVGCIAWNKMNPTILVSGSDDHSISIWEPKQANDPFVSQ